MPAIKWELVQLTHLRSSDDLEVIVSESGKWSIRQYLGKIIHLGVASSISEAKCAALGRVSALVDWLEIGEWQSAEWSARVRPAEIGSSGDFVWEVRRYLSLTQLLVREGACNGLAEGKRACEAAMAQLETLDALQAAEEWLRLNAPPPGGLTN